MKRVSVVILNWNGAAMLQRFLPSVVGHTNSELAEVVVADNGSTDSSAEVVRTSFPEVGWVQLDRNYGFAEGYNKALEQMESEYVVLLNSDVEVTPGWIDALVEYMDHHRDVAACQPKILSWHDKHRFEYAGAAGGFMDALGYLFCRGRIFDVVERDEHQYDDVCPLFWASGAALLIRLEDYTNVGGLDGRFFAHQEEIDLCWRLRSRGRRIVCVPRSVVYHVGGGTLGKENPRKTFLNFRNNLLMLYKNLPQSRFWVVMCLRFFLDYLAACMFLAKRQTGNARAVCRARREFWRLRPSFAEARKENLRKATQKHIPEQYGSSVLWKHYVCHKKTFQQLTSCLNH